MSVRQLFAAKVAAATVVVLVLVVGSSSALAGPASPRGGDLVVAKECSGFVPTNNPPYCQITASSLEQIEVGSKILYLDPGGLGTPAGGAVVLELPGPGRPSDRTDRLLRAKGPLCDPPPATTPSWIVRIDPRKCAVLRKSTSHFLISAASL